MTDNETDAARLTWRHKRIWSLHDFGVGRGLEIGPLHNTTVPRSMGEVYYVDVVDREALVAHYQGHDNVLKDRIPHIDFVLTDDTGRQRSLVEAAAAQAPYDWVMASHVVEHVPDLIGWLAEIAELTADGGRLVLAAPDRRRTFDLHRPATTVGQMLQAHELGEVRPSVRAVYDHRRSCIDTSKREQWSSRHPGQEWRRFTLAQVLEGMAKHDRGEYVDSHVWTFTPEELVDALVELRRLGLSTWRVVGFDPAPDRLQEFYTVLERLPRGTPAADAELSPIETERHQDMPEWLRREADQEQRIRELQGELRRARRVSERRAERVERLRRRLRREQADRQRLRGRLDRLESSVVVRVEARARRVARRLLRRR